MDQKEIYTKGNSMSYDSLSRESSEEMEDLKYLYPKETATVQHMVSEVCDQMEYEGSIMYDRFPDKITVERMADCICSEKSQCSNDSAKNHGIKALIWVMLCHEMKCRREKNSKKRNR